MTIEPVQGNGQLYDSNSRVQKPKPEETVTQTKKNEQGDRLTLSDEAKNLQPVVAKLNSGVYNKPDVLHDVAKKLSQELPPQK